MVGWGDFHLFIGHLNFYLFKSILLDFCKDLFCVPESDALEEKLYSPESNTTSPLPPVIIKDGTEKKKNTEAKSSGDPERNGTPDRNVTPEKKSSVERDRKLGSTAVADAYRVNNQSD